MLTHGLFAGTDVQRLLLRSVLGMTAGVLLGSVAGWLGLAIMKENINLPEDSAIAQAEPDNVEGQSAEALSTPPSV